MNVIICVDDLLGLGFNRRRQSQDRVLRERVLELCSGTLLWMSPYSERQFADCGAENIRADEDFLKKAGQDDFCFIEVRDIADLLPKISKLIIYRWNRVYASDRRLSIDLSEWRCESVFDFVGSSHEKITEEVYLK